jgi:hypothetical protein
MPVRAVVALTGDRLLVFEKRRRSRSEQDLMWATSMAGSSYQVLQVSGWRRHELVLLEACKRGSVTVVDFRRAKPLLVDGPVGWFTLMLRGEKVKFSYPPKMRRRGRSAGTLCMIPGFLLLFLVAWTIWLFALGGVLLGLGYGLHRVFPEPGDAIDRWQAALVPELKTELPATTSAPGGGRLSRLRTRWLLLLWAAWLGGVIAIGSEYPKRIPNGWSAALAITTLVLAVLTVARVIVAIRDRRRRQR